MINERTLTPKNVLPPHVGIQKLLYHHICGFEVFVTIINILFILGVHKKPIKKPTVYIYGKDTGKSIKCTFHNMSGKNLGKEIHFNFKNIRA